MNLSGLRRRLSHLADSAAPPEIRVAPHLLADLKRHWRAQWPEQTELDWPRHLGVINKVLAMNSEQRAALITELGTKRTATHTGDVR